MTGGDNNVSNVKMHSSQRNGHPTKRKKLTDQTAHSCPSQTDGTKKKKKGPPTDSAVLLRSLDRCAPHSLSQTKAQIKTSMAGATSLKKERRQEGDEVKERLKEGGEG